MKNNTYKEKLENFANSYAFFQIKAILKFFIPALIMFGLYIIFVILSKIQFTSEYFFARGITAFISTILNTLTNYLPFSVGITLIFFIIPLILCGIVYVIILICNKQGARLINCIKNFFIILFSVGIAYLCLYGGAYSRIPANIPLGIKTEKVNLQQVELAIDYFIEEYNTLSKTIKRDPKTQMPISEYSFEQINNKINESYHKLNNNYFSKFNVKAKKVLFSDVMSSLAISGVYTFYTAEANINMNTLDFNLPTVMAHEIAHAKGVTTENQANEVSYYVCYNSNDNFIKFSAVHEMLYDLVFSVKRIDKTAYDKLKNKLPQEFINETNFRSNHLKKYYSIISQISTLINDMFLKANGVSGGVSNYSQTTAFIVGFHNELIKK